MLLYHAIYRVILAMGKVVIAAANCPQSFNVVIFTSFWQENVQHNISHVENFPILAGLPFYEEGWIRVVFLALVLQNKNITKLITSTRTPLYVRLPIYRAEHNSYFRTMSSCNTIQAERFAIKFLRTDWSPSCYRKAKQQHS